MEASGRLDFEQYVVLRWPALVRSACALGCEWADAEDIAQRALVVAYPRWKRIQRATNPDAYVGKVLLNQFRDWKRKETRRERILEARSGWAREGASGAGLGDVADEQLLVALATLTEDQRRVLSLRYYFDLTERDVAEILGIAVGTVKSRHARALELIRSSMTLRP